MQTYCYCSVQPEDMQAEYYYISDDGPYPVGTRVAIPFGYQNTVVEGTVLSCQIVTGDEAPFPPEKTKHILYALGNTVGPKPPVPDDRYADALKEASDYLQAEDYESAFQWACEHEDIDDAAVMQMVVRCYEACMDQSMPLAALYLGYLYYNGTHLPRNYVKAYSLYKIAADAGIGDAICALGYCWYYGRHAERNYEKAYYYYSTGAMLFNDPNCLYKVGDMYENGLHVEKNEAYAFVLFSRALEQAGNTRECHCVADCLYRVGRCLLLGIGTDVNVEKGHALLCAALSHFYERRETDPFLRPLITRTKELIALAQEKLDTDLL